MERKKIATGYIRVSSKELNQLNSSQNQQSFFQRELLRDEDVEFLGRLYIDEGVTGTKLKRKAFHEMLQDAGLDIEPHITTLDNGQQKIVEYVYIPSNRTPKFDIIYVKNTSRFSRNVVVSDIIEKLVSKNVFIRFLDIGYTTEEKSHRDLINLFFSLDQRESRDKSTKVMFGKIESAKKGRIFTSGKLYGYRYIKEENRLEVIDEEAEIIRKIFNLYISGLGCRRISQLLNNEGYTKRQGKEFLPSDILDKLHNEKYAGINNIMKYSSGTIFENKINWSKPKRDGGYGKEQSDKIPAIIDLEIWKKAQEILINNQKYDNQKGKTIGRNLGRTKFASKIICSKCGKPFVRKTNSQGNHYLCCGTKHKHGVNACNAKNMSIEDIEAQIEFFQGKFLFNYIGVARIEMFMKIISLADYLLDTIDEDIVSTVKELDKKINETNTQIINGYRMQLTNSSEILHNLLKELEIELTNLKAQKQSALANNEEVYDDVNRLIQEYKYAYEQISKRKEFKVDELLDIIDVFLVREGTLVDIRLKCFKGLKDIYSKYNDVFGFSDEFETEQDFESALDRVQSVLFESEDLHKFLV